jgi:hypothetical protein
MLRACRQSGIDVEAWNEEGISPVDRTIDATLISLQGRVPWLIAAGTNYLSRDEERSLPLVTDTQILDQGILAEEKRAASRCQLRLPIRVRTKDAQPPVEEITETASVSRTGLRFVTPKNYDLGTELLIVYPYWATEDRFNEEYRARVVRKESVPEGEACVAVRFLETLGHKAPHGQSRHTLRSRK